MDKAPYYAQPFSPIAGGCFRLVSRQDGQAGRVRFFKIAGRTHSLCSNGAGQRRGDPRPDVPEGRPGDCVSEPD